MAQAKLTKIELAWIERFKKTMAAAPESLGEKVWAYTIGDDQITLYDKVKFESHFNNNPDDDKQNDDHHTLVDKADAEIVSINFPFPVESTSG